MSDIVAKAKISQACPANAVINRIGSMFLRGNAHMTTPPTPPPGWYPDPSGGQGQRYWDGANWTAVAPAAAPVAPPSSPFGPTAQIPQPPKPGLSTGLKIGLGVGGVALAMVALGSIGDNDAKKSGTSSSSSRVSSPTPQAETPSVPKTKEVAPAGSAVRDGKFEFAVVDVSTAKTVGAPDGNPYMQETAQGTFLVVTLNVTNIGDEPQSFFVTNQKLIDSQGRQYEPSSKADLYMNEDALGTDINPGNSIKVKAAFDVAPGIVASALELHDSMFSGGVSVALPGRVG